MKKFSVSAGLVPLLLILIIAACQKRLDKAVSEFDEALGAKPSTNTNKTITGQGAFIDFDVRGSYTTNGSKTFEYDKTEAESYFTHNDGIYSSTSDFNKLSGAAGETKKTSTKLTSLPSSIIDLIGYTPIAPTSNTTVYTASIACTPSAPAIPVVPSIQSSKMADLINSSACTFLNGGTLTGTTYTQTQTSPASCNYIDKVYYKYNPSSDRGWYIDTIYINGTYTYTYAYSITANEATKSVTPLTAWDEVAMNLGDGPTIPVGAFISRLQALSQQNSTGLDLSTAKYTFNLESQVTDPITLLSTWQSNISGIKIEVLDMNGSVINGVDGNSLVVNNPPHYIESNYNPETGILPLKDDPYAVDFKFAALAAANLTTSGISNQLFDFNKDGKIDSLDIKDARTILNTDGFANNDNGGNLGKALQKARMPAQPIQFPGTLVGDYQIRISANVAGLTSTATQTITHTQKINIIANCNGNQ